MSRRAIVATALCILALPLRAQTPVALDTIRVTVTRDTARSPLTLPFAIGAILPESTRPCLKGASLDHELMLVPAVFAATRQNPSQDPRFSIRGFGSRSTFGVRGVRVLWN